MKIPKGWYRLRTGESVRWGDKVLWVDKYVVLDDYWANTGPVKADEVIIRRNRTALKGDQ
jgi:hypothetical protein